jgi:hypothetical protein
VLASAAEVTVGFFDRLSNLGKGWIQVKKDGRKPGDPAPEVEQEIAEGPTQSAAGAAAVKPETPQAPPSEPKPDDPPARVKKTL